MVSSFAIAFCISIWIIHDTFIGGPEYRSAERRCGGKPIAGFIDVKRSTDKLYILPSSEAYNAPTAMYDAYFCTEEEAIEAGYERWVLS